MGATTMMMTTTTRKRKTMRRRRRKRLIPISERAAVTNRHKPVALVVSPERVQKSFLWRYDKALRGLCSLIFQTPFRRLHKGQLFFNFFHTAVQCYSYFPGELHFYSEAYFFKTS